MLILIFRSEITECYYPDLLNGHGEEDDAAGGRLTCAAGDALGDVDAGHALDEQRHLLDDRHHLKNGKCWNYIFTWSSCFIHLPSTAALSEARTMLPESSSRP